MDLGENAGNANQMVSVKILVHFFLTHLSWKVQNAILEIVLLVYSAVAERQAAILLSQYQQHKCVIDIPHLVAKSNKHTYLLSYGEWIGIGMVYKVALSLFLGLWPKWNVNDLLHGVKNSRYKQSFFDMGLRDQNVKGVINFNQTLHISKMDWILFLPLYVHCTVTYSRST